MRSLKNAFGYSLIHLALALCAFWWPTHAKATTHASKDAAYAACMAEIAVIFTERLGSPWFATEYKCIVDPQQPSRIKSFMWMKPSEFEPYGWFGFHGYYW